MSLVPVRACVFDAYGTLFDFASVAKGCEVALGGKAAIVMATWRDKLLQYSWLLDIQGRHTELWHIAGSALDYALETAGVEQRGIRDHLLDLYFQIDAFPEVPGVLESLKADGYATAILSNGTPLMLGRIVERAGIGSLLDHVISAEEVGVFKPSPRVYQRCCDVLGVAPNQVAFQSSNAWDAWAASAFGMRVFWCNRYAQQPERLPGRPDAEMRSLTELPGLISPSV